MKQSINFKLILLLIFSLGFILRLFDLGNIPSGFHADEAAFGYNAYSILNTGKDEYGKNFPLVLKSFGDYKGALYAYLTVPSVAIFGLTPFAARLPGVIIGSFTIILIFLFVNKLLGNRAVALIASFIFAILPWDIMISRVTGDVETGMFFTILAAYGLMFFNEKKSSLWFGFSLLSSFLAIISYAPYRIYVFLIPLIFFFISFQKVKNKISFSRPLLFFLISIFILGLIYNTLASSTRFNQVSIFSNPRTELILQEQIREDWRNPIFLTRIFHNKIVNFTRTVLHNAGEYFTLDYLFLYGGFPQRERIPDTGLFYLWQLPFLLIGFYLIARRRKKHEVALVLWWVILLSPAFFTFDEIPNVHRNLVIIPAIITIISLGIYEVLKKESYFRKLLLIGVLLVAFFELSYFAHQYFIHYDKHQPWYRGYAYKDLVVKLQKYHPLYKKIIVTKGNQSPYIYILFYSRYNPSKYQNEGSPRDLDYKGFDKYVFVPQGCPPIVKKEEEEMDTGEQGTLYVDQGDCPVPKGARLIDTVFWKDGTPAFKILDYPKNLKSVGI